MEASNIVSRRPVMKIFTGPPGTGKTREAAREAVKVLDGTVDDATVEERHKKLVEDGRVVWVSFHPSYSYEDFVEGLRPVNTEGTITYQVVPGPFQQLCSRCSSPLPYDSLVVGMTIPSAAKGRNYRIVGREPRGVILAGTSDREDKVGAGEFLQYVDFWTIERLQSLGVRPGEISIPGKDQPEKNNMAVKTSLVSTWFNNSGRHRAVWEYLNSAVPVRTPCVLVIDEINRADLSRVFGELITLLDADKRLGANEERTVVLPYSRTRFGVPAELSVIGTMNTADRSLTSFDYAFRRRFEFVEIAPDPKLCPTDWAGINVAALLTAMNDRIFLLLARDCMIGHSDLLEKALKAVAGTIKPQLHSTSDDTELKERALAFTLRRKIVPLLFEYFHSDPVRVALALGQKPGTDGLLGLRDATRLIDGGTDPGGIEKYAVEISGWWDPMATAWDSKRFRGALATCSQSIL